MQTSPFTALGKADLIMAYNHICPTISVKSLPYRIKKKISNSLSADTEMFMLEPLIKNVIKISPTVLEL
jgi:hypothetical protein